MRALITIIRALDEERTYLAPAPRSLSEAKYNARKSLTVGFVLECPVILNAEGLTLQRLPTASATAALVAKPAPALNAASK